MPLRWLLPPWLIAVCLVRKGQGHISLEVSEKALGCCHAELGWLAHGSGQLVEGVGDVLTGALAPNHQGPSNGLVKLRSREI